MSRPYVVVWSPRFASLRVEVFLFSRVCALDHILDIALLVLHGTQHIDTAVHGEYGIWHRANELVCLVFYVIELDGPCVLNVDQHQFVIWVPCQLHMRYDAV